MCNEEEDPKSLFNWWLKAYIIAIDLEELIRQNQELQIRNQAQELTGDRRDRARPGARFRGRTAAAAFWARVCPLAPCSPGAYKYPPGVSFSKIYRVYGSFLHVVV